MSNKKNLKFGVVYYLLGLSAFILIGICMFDIVSGLYNVSSGHKVFKGKMNDIGIMKFEGEDGEESNNDFCQKMLDDDIISNPVDFMNIGVHIKELAQVQTKYQPDVSHYGDGWAEVTFVDKNLFNLCNMKLNKGAVTPKEYELKEDEVGVYLGDKFKDAVKQNDTFVVKGGATYRVLGFIDQGEKMPSHRLQANSDNYIHGYDKCDFKVVALKGDYDEIDMLGAVMLFQTKDMSMKETKAKIKMYADKSNVDVSITPYRELTEINNKYSFQRGLEIILIIIQVCLLCLVYRRFRYKLSPENEKKNLIPTAIMSIIIFCVGSVVVYGIEMFRNDISDDTYWLKEVIGEILLKRTLPVLFIMMVVFFLVKYVIDKYFSVNVNVDKLNRISVTVAIVSVILSVFITTLKINGYTGMDIFLYKAEYILSAVVSLVTFVVYSIFGKDISIQKSDTELASS